MKAGLSPKFPRKAEIKPFDVLYKCDDKLLTSKAQTHGRCVPPGCSHKTLLSSSERQVSTRDSMAPRYVDAS